MIDRDDSAHFTSNRDEDDNESPFSAISGEAVVVVIGDDDVEHVVAGQVHNGVIGKWMFWERVPKTI